MAIQNLTDEQIRTWSREQKDRWWFENVYRGDMPQLTLRAAVTGFLLGGVLSATNLYVGAKTGWTLGVGLTSVILAFSIFKVLSRMGAKDMTILENNCGQSIATSAGYMTSPLISGIAAYMWVSNSTLNPIHMLVFNIVLSLLGVLVAFPMKRRFINDEQQPFPEGRAAGVVLDTLYSSHASVGLLKAKALAVSALLAGGYGFFSGEGFMTWIQERLLHFKKVWAIPTSLDGWYYGLVDKGMAAVPRLAGVDIRQLALSPHVDVALFGAGGLIGIRTAGSILIGMILNFVIIVPWMISAGEILPRSGSIAEGNAVFGRAHILNTWALWWGISIMVVAAIVSLFAKPQIFVHAFRSLFGAGKKAAGGTGEGDVLRNIELPLKVSFIGIPIIGALGVWMAYAWFGVHPWFGALAIPLIVVLTLIAASSTALTGITPTGSLSKIPQFTFGALDPKQPATNLMTGVMCTEVASNASNLLMDIKPGYMLGAKPRQQAVGHTIGILSGALASTPLFYVLFLSNRQPGATIMETMAPDGGQFSFPAAAQWKGVSDLVTSVFGAGGDASLLSGSILTSMIVAAIAGLVLEVIRIATRFKFPISPLAIGLGVLVPPDGTIMMFLGSLFFWFMHRRYFTREGTTGHVLWVQTQEPICAGLIAGAALMGIGDTLVRVFLLR